MMDRYTKMVLTVIAGTLLYIAAVVTPLPTASAQQPTLRPGESSGPTQVIVVGWQAGGREAIPVSIQQTQPLRIEGAVTTERSSTRLADRVLLVGWEPGADREKPTRAQPISENSRLPVQLPTPQPR